MNESQFEPACLMFGLSVALLRLQFGLEAAGEVIREGTHVYKQLLVLDCTTVVVVVVLVVVAIMMVVVVTECGGGR